MDALAKAIENELEKAFPVQDREALQRCSRLLSEELVQHHHYNYDIAQIHADIKLIIEKMDERFEAVDKRFEAVDKRFDDLIHHMDRRFESSEKRFEALQHNMDKRFEVMQHDMDARFDSIDRRFTHMFRFMSLGFTLLALLLTVFNFL